MGSLAGEHAWCGVIAAHCKHPDLFLISPGLSKAPRLQQQGVPTFHCRLSISFIYYFSFCFFDLITWEGRTQVFRGWSLIDLTNKMAHSVTHEHIHDTCRKNNVALYSLFMGLPDPGSWNMPKGLVGKTLLSRTV